MKILLTGYKGFIGSHMLRALQERGDEVIGFEWGEPLPIVDNSLDYVIHMGAISSTTERNVSKVIKQNYDFTCALYNACIDAGVPMQFSSSASIYGLSNNFSDFSPEYDPRTPYAWSKLYAEHHIAMHPTLTTRFQIFRYFNVYGPEGEEHKGGQASPHCQFKKQANETGKIKVFENSDQYKRDFVHVSQVIDTHLKFFNITESGIWNIGTGTATSFLDIAKSFNVPIEEIPMPEELKHSYQPYTCADTTKLNDTLKRNGF